jgi:chromate transporter
MKPGAILSLISFFSVLSILSIGGSNSVVPEMARHAVGVEHWLTAAQFTDIFAISQATPGPSNLIVALIGFKVAGFWGALVAQLAMMLPAASLMLLVSRIWVASSGKPLAPRPGTWPCADCRRPHLRQRDEYARSTERRET